VNARATSEFFLRKPSRKPGRSNCISKLGANVGHAEDATAM
jgi:hypothetical protein